jgi:uncharacterized protein (UPF0276 family)
LELSVNYSLQAEALLQAGKISCDRLKCPDWPDTIAAARKTLPVYVHFPLDAGSTSGRPPNFAAADVMARETDSPFVNLHLVTYHRDFPEHPSDSTDPQLESAVMDQMLRDIEAATAVVGRDRVIVENIPYFGGGSEYHRASVEPTVIRRVIEQSGCGFLLDVSHARIAAHYMGLDPHEYILSLPVHRLAELHLTGVRTVGKRLADHMDLLDEDWNWAQWAMQRIRAGEWPRPWTVALEYGGVGEPFKWRSDQSVLEEQVPRLAAMVKKC